ncbi:helix-turn-helix domain-containing protein [Parablautia sp. Marseille-Q6255]|uniref:helix-turn-helix domain-containing protein n=1 Tax=Parablautia sp. Marseille-Q6255 TaxID=3039593 RepID=UPI0024BD1E44|nr:helix-turn-helix domain-containing protein [Parablautia sp. Marseille-Q6255]
MNTKYKEKRVYEVEDIQEILNIGRTKAYAFIQEVYHEQKPFKVIKIGNIYRIPKASFDRWLDECN